MAVAVAAPPAVSVSTPMLAQMIVLVCGLATSGSAAPADAPTVRGCPDCVESCTTDSLRAATVRRARHAARDGAWNDAADIWRDALLLDERSGADWLAFGDVLSHTERHREAAAAYQRAIQLDGRLTERGTRGVARAYARSGDDRQAVRWLEQALRLGVRPAELWTEESFRRYRDVPRLQSELRRQVSRGGRPAQRPAST
jgi:cytochrome c-type biogenesis protein CcmH/NrfG